MDLHGTLLVVGTTANEILLIDLYNASKENKSNKTIFNSHFSNINDIAPSPKGETFVSCSNDKTVRVWSTTKLIVAKIVPYTPTAVDWSQDEEIIIIGSSDGALNSYKVKEKFANVNKLKTNFKLITCIKISPSNSFVAYSGQVMNLCNVEVVPINKGFFGEVVML